MGDDRLSHDVIVVGAGPAGSMAAKYAAKSGASTLMIEEDDEIGEPVRCAGLISTRAVSECEVSPNHFTLKKVKGASVYSPSCDEAEIEANETKAYVIDRKAFDEILAAQALDEGAEIMLSTKAVGLKRSGGELIVEAKNGEKKLLKADAVIGADGVSSKIAKLSGLGKVEKVLPAAQVECSYECDSELVEIFLGKTIAPGFFAWSIPTSENTARVGLCTSSGDALSYLRNLLDNHRITSKRYKGCVIDSFRGAIPMGPPDKTASDNIFIVGDAAGQVKPTSGGGIFYGMRAAKIAGEMAAEGSAEEYERRWRAAIGRELGMGMKIRKFMARLSDSELEKLVELVKDKKILDIARTYGDMDYPSVFVRKFIRKKPLDFLKILFHLFNKTASI